MSAQLVAQWVSAIGSAGSLLGFAAYVLIMLLNRKDQAEVRREQQAQGVASWLSDGSESSEAPAEEQFVLCVHNGGDTPVFNVKCLFSLPSSNDQHTIGLSLIPPTTTAHRSMPFDPAGISEEELHSAPAVPEMRFTDSHGTNWQRDGNGQLKRLDRRTLRDKPQGGADSDDRDDAQWEREHRQHTGDTGTRHHGGDSTQRHDSESDAHASGAANASQRRSRNSTSTSSAQR